MHYLAIEAHLRIHFPIQLKVSPITCKGNLVMGLEVTLLNRAAVATRLNRAPPMMEGDVCPIVYNAIDGNTLQ